MAVRKHQCRRPSLAEDSDVCAQVPTLRAWSLPTFLLQLSSISASSHSEGRTCVLFLLSLSGYMHSCSLHHSAGAGNEQLWGSPSAVLRKAQQWQWVSSSFQCLLLDSGGDLGEWQAADAERRNSPTGATVPYSSWHPVYPQPMVGARQECLWGFPVPISVRNGGSGSCKNGV